MAGSGSQIGNLDNATCDACKNAAMGTKLNALITMLNELKANLNATAIKLDADGTLASTYVSGGVVVAAADADTIS